MWHCLPAISGLLFSAIAAGQAVAGGDAALPARSDPRLVEVARSQADDCRHRLVLSATPRLSATIAAGRAGGAARRARRWVFGRSRRTVRCDPRHQHEVGLALLHLACPPGQMHAVAQARLGPGTDLAAASQWRSMDIRPRRRQPRTAHRGQPIAGDQRKAAAHAIRLFHAERWNSKKTRRSLTNLKSGARQEAELPRARLRTCAALISRRTNAGPF